MKTIIGVIFLFFAILIGMTELEKDRALFYHSLNADSYENNKTTISDYDTIVTVTISGEVNKPGTYSMNCGNFLTDIIEKAGGITSNADIDCFDFYLVVEKSLSIYIPPITSEEKISLNDASLDELCTLNGIGKVIGNKIIDYRKENYKFYYLEQLLEVEGVGKSVFYKIRDNICL